MHINEVEQLAKFQENLHESNKIFHFAKINVHGNIFKPNLEEIIEKEIPRVISSTQEIQLKYSRISFTDLLIEEIEGRKVILGHVTYSKKEKLRFKDGPTTYISKTDKEIANSALFIYDLKSEIIAFTTTTKIGTNDFICYFTKLLSQDEIVGKVVVQLIPDAYDIIKQFKLPEKVTYIKFSLIQPNPRARHYNRYYNFINEVSAKSMDIIYRDEEDGLDINKPAENMSETQNIQQGLSTHLAEQDEQLEKNDESQTEHSSKEDAIIESEFIKPIYDGIELIKSGYGDVEIRGENYTYVESGKKKRKLKKIKHKSKFNSKESTKKLSVRGLDSSHAIKKVISFIKNISE